MTLRIRSEFNPPEELRVIAEQIIYVPENIEMDYTVVLELRDREKEFIREYIQVVTEEVEE